MVLHGGNDPPRPATVTTSAVAHRDPVAAAERLMALLARGAAGGRPRRCQALHRLICDREGCGKPLPAVERRRGDPKRFCSTRCRWLDWRAKHPRRAVATS